MPWMRARALLTIGLVLGSGVGGVLAACGSFDVGASGGSDASVDDGAIDAPVDGAEDRDAGADAANDCPPPPSGCDGGVLVSCPQLEDRCFFYCPQRVPSETAQATCAEWGGACLAGLTTPEHVRCLTAVASDGGQHIHIDFFQEADAPTPDAGWAPKCAQTVASFEWNGQDPDDDDNLENGEQQCAILLTNGRVGDSECGTIRAFVCERSR